MIRKLLPAVVLGLTLAAQPAWADPEPGEPAPVHPTLDAGWDWEVRMSGDPAPSVSAVVPDDELDETRALDPEYVQGLPNLELRNIYNEGGVEMGARIETGGVQVSFTAGNNGVGLSVPGYDADVPMSADAALAFAAGAIQQGLAHAQ